MPRGIILHYVVLFSAYAVLWFLCLFCLLPVGLGAERDPETGAPLNPMLKKKALIATGDRGGAVGRLLRRLFSFRLAGAVIARKRKGRRSSGLFAVPDGNFLPELGRSMRGHVLLWDWLIQCVRGSSHEISGVIAVQHREIIISYAGECSIAAALFAASPARLAGITARRQPDPIPCWTAAREPLRRPGPDYAGRGRMWTAIPSRPPIWRPRRAGAGPDRCAAAQRPDQARRQCRLAGTAGQCPMSRWMEAGSTRC